MGRRRRRRMTWQFWADLQSIKMEDKGKNGQKKEEEDDLAVLG
jgi:hypothetical protein